MGIAYYLLREDTHEVYDLGKAYGWGVALATRWVMVENTEQVPMHAGPFTGEDIARLAAELDTVWRSQCSWTGEECPTEYHELVAADIIDWAQGHPVTYVSESDARIENWDSEYRYPEADEHGWRQLRETGSRFYDEMDKHAEKRRAQRAVRSVMQ